MAKDYDQYCPLVAGFAQVGDRWTLIIIRDLLFGPQRYSDLQASLPGIGTNLLASRLKQLQASGIIAKRQLPPPAASAVYELTELGRGLEPVILEVGKWGMQFLSQHAPGDLSFADLLRSRAGFAMAHLPPVLEEYEFVIDGNPVTIRAGAGLFEVEEGSAPSPLTKLTLDAGILMELHLPGMTLAEVEAMGQVVVDGDRAACERALDLFRIPKSQSSPSAVPASVSV